MLVQPTKEEGDKSKRQSDPLPTPSPPYPSEAHDEPQADSSSRPLPNLPIPSPPGSGGDQGGQSPNDKSLSGSEGDLTIQSVYDMFLFLCKQVTSQAKEIIVLKAKLKKFKRKATPLISHHQAWVKSVKRKQRLAKKEALKKKRMQKESVSKQGRKVAKDDPFVHKDQVADDFNDGDGVDYMEEDDGVSTDNQNVSTDSQKVSTNKQRVSTGDEKVSTDRQNVSTDQMDEGIAEPIDDQSATPTPPTVTPASTTTMFGNDETIAQVLIIMSQNKDKLKEKEKGVELRDVEESERPRPTSTKSILTLKPLPKIDPKDKGKKRIEEDESDESDTESEGIFTAEKKFKQLSHDEEMAKKIQEEWVGKEERKRLAEEEATNDALIRNYDDIKARIEADRLLAERLQEEEREQFTVEERAKFLHDTIATQRKFLA
ncbi:hypothetical protein Tco_0149818 [Tanacetum coccineum]